MTTRHAEIAGAGLCGLATAAALARAGWTVRVHERDDSLREIGAGIAIWENGTRALRAVGAYDLATADAERIANWQLRDERDRLLQREWMLTGVSESYAILRTTLHQALAAAAQSAGAEIMTGSAVAGARPDGTLVLADGRELKADLVVGADGVNSRVRESAGLTRKVVDLHDGCGRHLVRRLPADPQAEIIECWQGGRRIGIVPCSPEWVYIYLCCPEKDEAGRTQGESRDTWLESFPHMRHFIERIQDGGRWASFSSAVTRSWSSGRIAVIGDAAHSMAPNLGQAACVGMSNAVALTKALGKFPDVQHALRQWEAAERPVSDRTQRYSNFYGTIGTKWPAPLLDARSAIVWCIAHSRRMQRHINVAFRHIPGQQLDDPSANLPQIPAR